MAELKVSIDGVTPSGGTLPVSGTVTATKGSVTATTSLSGVTTGTGTTVDFGSAGVNITMAILVTGTVTAGVMGIDTSQDGTNWVANGTVNLTTSTNAMLSVSSEAWRYARARVTTNITGGATATCTLMGG